MGKKIFLEHYRVCTKGGDPIELNRADGLVSYKAVDGRFDETVAITRIPTADIDPAERKTFEEQARAARVLDHVNIAKLLGFGIQDDDFVFVTEYLEGDTLDTWVASHGPMPPEAVLRVALQVVNAVAAAGYHGVTHRAIQPSNLAIVPSQVAEGGWPFVKLTNFGMSRSNINSAAASQFSSPEQQKSGISDFRSEIYSLGATMCFLLSGASSSPEARLQQLKQLPKPLRNLLAPILSENPENRPQDPVVLAEAVRECMTSVARREEFARKFAIPVFPVFRNTRPRSAVWMPRRSLAIAALVLLLAVLAGVLWPKSLETLFHPKTAAEPIGVPIGVSDAAIAQQPAPPPSNPSNETSLPSVASTNQPALVSSDSTNLANTPEPAQPVNPPTPEVAANNRKAEPEPLSPAAGPGEAETVNSPEQDSSKAKSENNDADSSGTHVATESAVQSEQSNSNETAADTKALAPPKVVTSLKRRSPDTVSRPRVTRRTDQSERGLAPSAPGTFRARVVGSTPDGRVILSLPNGETAIAEPPRHRVRRYRVERDERFRPPFQPFDPGYPVGD